MLLEERWCGIFCCRCTFLECQRDMSGSCNYSPRLAILTFSHTLQEEKFVAILCLMSKYLSSSRYIFQMLTQAFEEAILIIWKGVLFLKLQCSMLFVSQAPQSASISPQTINQSPQKKLDTFWNGILWQLEKVKALWLLLQAAIYHFFPSNCVGWYHVAGRFCSKLFGD